MSEKAIKLNKKDIFMTGVIKENPVLKMMLGMCPALAVTNSFENAFGMGLMVVIILTFSNLVISLLRNVIPNDVRIPSYIVIIATLVTALHMFVQAFAGDLSDSLGVFIPLIAVNCIVLGRAESFASKNKPLDSVVDGLGAATGFALAISLVGILREIIGLGSVTFGKVLPLPFEATLTLFPKDFAIGVFVSPPGAFLVIGILLAIFAAVGNAKPKKKVVAKK
jgi:Na+-translocating ferredoxin:NAD+ oxidoreductase subunit E